MSNQAHAARTTRATSPMSRAAERAVERARSARRLTVVPRRAVRAPRVPFVALVSLLLVGGVAGLLYFNTSMQQRSFAITSLSERADALAAQQQTLQMEIDRLRDPQNVAEQAVHLGMVPAPSPAFIRLADGAVLGHAEPATGQVAMPVEPPGPVKPKALDPHVKIQYVDPQGHVVPKSQVSAIEGDASGTASPR